MPHLWMFLLKSLTPPGHQVFLLDGNAHRMSEPELVRYVHEHDIRLVGVGAMTRMAAKAYRMADAVRAAGVPVVMGGPHITEVPGEAMAWSYRFFVGPVAALLYGASLVAIATTVAWTRRRIGSVLSARTRARLSRP